MTSYYIPSFLIPAGIGLIFLILALLALRIRKAWLRWPVLVLGLLLTLVFAALTVFSQKGEAVMENPTTHPGLNLSVWRRPDRIARGKQLAIICAQCHSSTGKLPLDGGTTDFLGGGLFGSLYAPNLTPGGEAFSDWSDGLLVRALREGIDDDNIPLLIMPSEFYHVMSDEDAQSIVAFLRSQPAVAHEVPARRLSWMVEALIGAGMFPTSVQPPNPDPQVGPSAGPTPEYGKYLVAIFACGGCHGADLGGKKPGQGPAGPNLTQLIPPMPKAIFIQSFRQGKDAGKEMPFEEISSVASDDDLTAMYLYLHSLTPLPNK
jgi:mono/diheme cytochrome c family protein